MAKFKSGPQNPRWNGGRRVHYLGYIQVLVPTHPRADRYGYVYEHLLVAEKALGKPLPPGVEVHHFDRVRSNNRNQNLVICQDHAYHQLLEQRQDALRESGHATWIKCPLCKFYDEPQKLFKPLRGHPYHRKCRAEYVAVRRRKARNIVDEELESAMKDLRNGG